MDLLRPDVANTSSPFTVEPGEVVHFDEFNEIRPARTDNHIIAVQWNIERGYKLDAIIELLRRQFLDADIIALQELDIHCERSGWRDSALEIARALKMRCIFVPEFVELHSPLRSKKSQGGGWHGNAILTWWDVEAAEAISHSPEFNWNEDGNRLGEPRRGGRFSVAASLRNPHQPDQHVLAYSVHLEVFCGIFGRMRQFSQILAHSRAHLATHPYQMILGDLNTMAHGLARFFSRYCCDAMRWRSLGWSEAEWWQKNLMEVTPEWAGPDGVNALLAAHHHLERSRGRGRGQFIDELMQEDMGEASDALHEPRLEEYYGSAAATNLDRPTTTTATQSPFDRPTPITATQSPDRKQPGRRIFTTKQLKALVNPHFYCPFSPRTDMTLQVRGFAGKLDWMLVRGFDVQEKGLLNDKYDRSDHKLLWMHATFTVCDGVSGEAMDDPGPKAYAEYCKKVDVKRDRIASLIGPNPHRRQMLICGAAIGVLVSVICMLINKSSRD